MAISALPLYGGTAPNRNQDQASFNTNMASWVSYTATSPTNYNTFATQANALALEVSGYADDALASANDAEASAEDADNSAMLAAASANYVGEYSALTGAKNKGISASHLGAFWVLNTDSANITADVPGVSSKWTFLSGSRWQPLRTANFTAQKNSMNKVEVASGTVVATLSAFIDTDFFCIANSPSSAGLVRISKAGVTVQSGTVIVAAGDNITLRPGQTFYAYATSSTALKVTNNG